MLPITCYLVLIKVKYGMYNQTGFLHRYFKRIVVNWVPLILATGLTTRVLMVIFVLKLIVCKTISNLFIYYQFLDTTSFLTQAMILCPIAISFVILYPTLEVWSSLSQLEKRRSRHHSTDFEDRSSLDLKERLIMLCNRVGFPNKQVLIHSSGSSETSAFYYGFLCYRRIVVFQGYNLEDDGNLEDLSDDGNNPVESDSLSAAETEAIVAHELGHWRYTHSDTSLLINFQIKDVFTEDSGISCLPGAFIAYYIILRVYYFVS